MRLFIGILSTVVLVGGLSWFIARDLGFWGLMQILGLTALVALLAFGLTWGFGVAS